jgi:hypothetical protein
MLPASSCLSVRLKDVDGTIQNICILPERIFGVRWQDQLPIHELTAGHDGWPSCGFVEQSAIGAGDADRRAPAIMSVSASVFEPGAHQHVSRPLSGLKADGIELLNMYSDLESVADITKCLSIWSEELVDDIDRVFLLAGVAEGFHIIDSVDLPVP